MNQWRSSSLSISSFLFFKLLFHCLRILYIHVCLLISSKAHSLCLSSLPIPQPLCYTHNYMCLFLSTLSLLSAALLACVQNHLLETGYLSEITFLKNKTVSIHQLPLASRTSLLYLLRFWLI